MRVVLMLGVDLVLLRDWTWATFDYLHRTPRPVRVFPSTRAADRARRHYGRGRWREMEIVKV